MTLGVTGPADLVGVPGPPPNAPEDKPPIACCCMKDVAAPNCPRLPGDMSCAPGPWRGSFGGSGLFLISFTVVVEETGVA